MWLNLWHILTPPLVELWISRIFSNCTNRTTEHHSEPAPRHLSTFQRHAICRHSAVTLRHLSTFRRHVVSGCGASHYLILFSNMYSVILCVILTSCNDIIFDHATLLSLRKTHLRSQVTVSRPGLTLRDSRFSSNKQLWFDRGIWTLLAFVANNW